MADKEAEPGKMNSKLAGAAAARPTITLPPRPAMDTFFLGGLGISPGPMTLVSNLFSDNYPDGADYRSFSQLLAGAMVSPVPGTAFSVNVSTVNSLVDGGEKDSGFKQSKPLNLVVARSPLFTVPPGLSPSGLLNSPGFFPLSPQSPFGISHQQALAHVTAQAALAQSQMRVQADYQPLSVVGPSESLTRNPSLNPDEASQQMPTSTSNLQNSMIESSEASQSDRKSQPSSLPVDKPTDDGYNWRKYGQKPIKGCEYPRSYYKCTYLNCPVKKKVERSADGQITEIIYKGQHNHEMPQPSRQAKGASEINGNANSQAKPKVDSDGLAGNLSNLGGNLPTHSVHTKNLESTAELPGSSDSEEVGDEDIRERNDDEPNPKRRNTAGETAVPPSHKTVTEPKIIVQTRSEVDLLDDGYRWRKYGQKVVKGNPHPRSYYKCTSAGCNVRKHVERASTDPKAVITTYEGKHNHDVPAARNSSHNIANSSAMQLKPDKVVTEPILKEGDFGNNQRPILLQLKEEQVRV
ncbi:hypothetical protein SLEP1_g10440 [Rubroshorea leprosula]|uniref:WRKY domain-containing protein n=1 Tax=Rubroshorea leprosula TaxID=152421 RepID=A0AAV5IE00_9ROSI|nr:hypothetical protein SLEP1_g10440 [Rubroshorea leprosula]